jgi:periplasmic protein CpxP/Spy
MEVERLEMKTILSNNFASAAVAALLFLPVAAVAQSSPTPAATTPQGAQPPAVSSPIAGHPVAGKNAEERVERRITELRTQLRITPAEQQQWDQFAGVMRENARDMDRIFIQRAQQLDSMTALQNMQSYEQLAEAHAQHLQKLVSAFQTLYDAMPDQQKQLADQIFHANAEQHAQQPHRGRNG